MDKDLKIDEKKNETKSKRIQGIMRVPGKSMRSGVTHPQVRNKLQILNPPVLPGKEEEHGEFAESPKTDSRRYAAQDEPVPRSRKGFGSSSPTGSKNKDADTISKTGSRSGVPSTVFSVMRRPPPGVATQYTVAQKGAHAEHEAYYHGRLPHSEAEALLKKEGDFLLRKTVKKGETFELISVRWQGGVKHFPIQFDSEGRFRLEGPSFDTITDLINYYWTVQEPVTSHSGALLKHPVRKEDWELSHEDVQLGLKIGNGNFGEVYEGRLNLGEDFSKSMPVAIKVCSSGALSESDKSQFLREAKLLRSLVHANVVRFIGICSQKEPVLIVLELVVGGNLLAHLRKNKGHLAQAKLINCAFDASKGMEYLESRKCIHRDLAARNCLLSDKDRLKISDFGMSQQTNSGEFLLLNPRPVPVKWTAPEGLNYGTYTHKSDVWSYGILLWEIFTEGETPYPGKTNEQARKSVEAGYRLPRPKEMPCKLSEIMAECWKYDPEERPTFTGIRVQLSVVYKSQLRKSETVRHVVSETHMRTSRSRHTS